MAHAFDTLAAAKMLADAGMDRRQAEAVASTVRQAVDDSAATKADLATLDALLTWRFCAALAAHFAATIGAIFVLLKMLLP